MVDLIHADSQMVIKKSCIINLHYFYINIDKWDETQSWKSSSNFLSSLSKQLIYFLVVAVFS